MKNELSSELEPVRQNGTGPAGPDRTGTGPVEKVNRAGQNRNFTGRNFKKIFLVNLVFENVKLKYRLSLCLKTYRKAQNTLFSSSTLGY